MGFLDKVKKLVNQKHDVDASNDLLRVLTEKDEILTRAIGAGALLDSGTAIDWDELSKAIEGSNDWLLTVQLLQNSEPLSLFEASYLGTVFEHFEPIVVVDSALRLLLARLESRHLLNKALVSELVSEEELSRLCDVLELPNEAKSAYAALTRENKVIFWIRHISALRQRGFSVPAFPQGT
jgi:hypothetical protein